MNLDDVQFNDKDSNAINYVKARMAIEEQMPNRESKRNAKMVVINHFGGVIKHPDTAGQKRPAMVIFPDHTKARF